MGLGRAKCKAARGMGEEIRSVQSLAIRKRFDRSVKLESHLDLFHPGSLKPQVEAVVGQTADLRAVPVVTHADDGNLGILYQSNEFLERESPRHSQLLGL